VQMLKTSMAEQSQLVNTEVLAGKWCDELSTDVSEEGNALPSPAKKNEHAVNVNGTIIDASAPTTYQTHRLAGGCNK
jgi:hypothetical protein